MPLLPDSPRFGRDYRLFLASLTAATLATQIQGAAVGYALYHLTRNPFAVGAAGLAEALPFVSLALFGGHVADTFDRRRVCLIGFSAMALAALALVALDVSRDWLGTQFVVRALYGLIAVGGVTRSFLQPARVALGAQLVPRALYARSVTWRTGLFQLSAVVGPALGGGLIAWAGARLAFSATAVLLAVAAVTLSLVRAPARERTARAPVWASVREGARYLFGEPVLLAALTLDLFAVLFGGATALLPVFAEEILHVGAQGFGLLRASPAVGALLASAILATRPPLRRAGHTLLISVAGFGATMIGFGLSRSFALSLALLTASGALDMVSVLVRSTLLQLRVPAEMLGRVSSINQIFIGSSNEIGAFESGVAARALGTVPSVVAGGVVTIAVVGVVAWKSPALRRLGTLT